MSSYHGWTHAPKEQGGTDPIPGLVTAGALPYPPVWPNTAMTSHLTEHRFWPGGMIVVPAYAHAVDGTVETGGNDHAFANDGLSHDQTAASFAAAAVTCSFTPEDIGLPTGDDAPFYGVFVGMRIDNTGTNIGVRMSPKGFDPHASDDGFGRYVFSTGTVKSYFGLFRLVYTKSAGFPVTGYIRQFVAGEDIEFKLYRTGGSGKVVLDNIYFVPALNARATAPTDLSEQVAHVLSMSLYSELSATAQYSGFGGTPSEPYCDLGGGGSGIQDTQIRRGWRDPDLEWSGACGMSANFMTTSMTSDIIADRIVYYPRHVYAACRIRGAGDVLVTHTTDLGGFVTYGQDSLPVGQAHVHTDHWGLYYLGCHPHMIAGQGENNFALWMPNQDDDFPVGFPACSTGDNALFEAMVGHDVYFLSSAYDWLHYKNGEYAYAAESVL